MIFSTLLRSPTSGPSRHKVNTPESTLLANDTLKVQVELDHPLWKDYVENAASFDDRMVDEWNRIVDVILVYVALFISVLISFVIETSKIFKRNPVDTSNDLILGIYVQMLFQYSNISNPFVIDALPVEDQDEIDYKAAIVYNALLYSSLALCTVVSVIAVAAKLWLVAYGQRAFSGGTLYERAMKRQEAYGGILAWKMGTVINSLPLVLLLALLMFGFFIHLSLLAADIGIAYPVGTIISLGLFVPGVASLAAAFIPSCPFYSSYSTPIQLCFKIPEELLNRILTTLCKRLEIRLAPTAIRWLRIGVFTSLGFGLGAMITYATLTRSSIYTPLICVPVAITFAYSMQESPGADHKPQKFRLPLLILLTFLIIAPILAAAGYFRNPQKSPFFISLYTVGMLVLFAFGWMASGLSKSMEETREIDAIAWLLNSTPSHNPTLFKKASQIASRGDYQPRFLTSIMPLLSSLITSHYTDNDPQLLEIYVSCLAQLSNFMDVKGSFWCLWENARQHPTLEEPLREKLKKLAQDTRDVPGLRSAAAKVLHNFNLNGQGENLVDLGSMAKLLGSPHLDQERELRSRLNDGYKRWVYGKYIKLKNLYLE